jgi:hypothetical protein
MTTLSLVSTCWPDRSISSGCASSRSPRARGNAAAQFGTAQFWWRYTNNQWNGKNFIELDLFDIREPLWSTVPDGRFDAHFSIVSCCTRASCSAGPFYPSGATAATAAAAPAQSTAGSSHSLLLTFSFALTPASSSCSADRRAQRVRPPPRPVQNAITLNDCVGRNQSLCGPHALLVGYKQEKKSDSDSGRAKEMY